LGLLRPRLQLCVCEMPSYVHATWLYQQHGGGCMICICPLENNGSLI
jgi:hypothetical protein